MNLHDHVTHLRTNAWMTAVVEPHGNFPPLAETAEQQRSLNTLTQRSLPALPYGAWTLDSVLIAPRLRFGPPVGGSPFRGPLDPAVLYAAPTKNAALMDMAYHRWRFLSEASDDGERSRHPERARRRSSGNSVADNALFSTSRLAVFEVQLRTSCVDLRTSCVDLRTSCVDLRSATLQQDQHPRQHRSNSPNTRRHRSDSPNTRRHHNDFRNTQRIGRLARIANVGALVYACPGDRVGADEALGAGETRGADEALGADDNWRVVILDPDAFWLAEVILACEMWSMRVTRRQVEFHPLHGETSVSTDLWRQVRADRVRVHPESGYSRE